MPRDSKHGSERPHNPLGAGRPPGSRRSHAYNPWTPEEREILEWAEREGVTATPLLRSGKLPGRSIIDIQNQFGIMRTKARGVCPKCRTTKTQGGVHCTACKKKMTEYRESSVRKGLCSACGRPRGEGSTATTCADCREKKQSYIYHPKKRKPKETMPRELSCLFPWVRPASTRIIADNAHPTDQVVDLFTGSGRTLAWVMHRGLPVLSYNDAHPLLTHFVQEALRSPESLWGRIREEMGKPEWWKRIEARYRSHWASAKKGIFAEDAAEVFYLMARATKGQMRIKPHKPSDPKPFLVQARWLATKLTPQHVTCLDFAEAIQQFDAPGVLFLADPPWPEDIGFEIGVDSRHRELVELLLGAKGEFILATQSSEASLGFLADVPYLYWAWVWAGREILASSRPLTEGKLKRFRLEDLGR